MAQNKNAKPGKMLWKKRKKNGNAEKHGKDAERHRKRRVPTDLADHADVK